MSVTGYIKTTTACIFSIILLAYSIVFGRTLEGWTNQDAYKPNPILFLHGFAIGNAGSWDFIKLELAEYFNDYDETLTFLETISFNDPNGSIDTYPDGRDGWADKVKIRVEELRNLYKFKGQSLPVGFVCHSMGGLAAREYITNSKYGNSYLNIKQLITIGTPHTGTSLANVKKIEEAMTGEHKYIWEVPYGERFYPIVTASADDAIIEFIKSKLKLNPDGEAVKDMAIGSEFLQSLNSRIQPVELKNYSIYGEAASVAFQLVNNIFFSIYYPNEPFTCGDGVVPRDSQIGVDIMTNYPDTTPRTVWSFDKITKILIDHFHELDHLDTPKKILFFLDSTPPEFQITFPASGVEIFENSIHIQGLVYKEYLPADSTLTINVTRQEDGTVFPKQTSFLKPSDLWIPNNPDSPVAEFDEVVNFPGTGTYNITLVIINPAGNSSNTQALQVKVSNNASTIVDIAPVVSSGYLRKSGTTYEKARQSTPEAFASSYACGQMRSCSFCYALYRCFLSFDTAALVNKEIISAKLILRVDYNSVFGIIQPVWGSDFTLECYASNWATGLDADDWDNYGALLGSKLITRPPSGGAYVTIGLSPAIIQGAAVAQFALISDRDHLSLAPSAGEVVALSPAVLRVEYKEK